MNKDELTRPKKERVLFFFPAVFYILGLFTQAFTSIVKGIYVWIVFIAAMFIYTLMYLWFSKEYRQEVKTYGQG